MRALGPNFGILEFKKGWGHCLTLHNSFAFLKAKLGNMEVTWRWICEMRKTDTQTALLVAEAARSPPGAGATPHTGMLPDVPASPTLALEPHKPAPRGYTPQPV